MENYNEFLYGRLPIYTSSGGFSPERPDEIISEVNEALSIHVQNLISMEYLYWYRRGITPIYNKTKLVRPEINHKVSENIYGSIVDFKNGYFLTKPAFYISRKDDEQTTAKVSELNEYLYRSGKQKADNKLVDWFHTVGKADLFVAASDEEGAPYKAYALDPRCAFVVRSTAPGNPAMYAVYSVVTGDRLRVDVWDRNYVYHLSGTCTGKLVTPEPNCTCTVVSVESLEANPLGEIPIIEYYYNSVMQSAAEAVIPLLDALNDLESGRMDSIDQFVQSLLIFYNCELEEGDDGRPITTKMVREAGALFLKNVNETKADVKEISSVLDQSQMQTFVDHLYSQILAICGIPPVNGQTGTMSTTGLAEELRGGWATCEQMARNCEDLFKESNAEFDRIVLKILREKNILDISINDFELNFPRNDVRGVQTKAQALRTMIEAGLHPVLALSKSGLSADPASDFEMSKDYMRLRWGDPNEPVQQVDEQPAEEEAKQE